MRDQSRQITRLCEAEFIVRDDLPAEQSAIFVAQ